VGDADRVGTAIEIVESARAEQPVVVVSALAGVTNELVRATDVAAAGRFQEVTDIVTSVRQRHETVGMALVRQKSDYFDSFLAQVTKHTDQIQDILRGISLVGEVSLRARDKIVAIGEKLSSVLFAYSMRLRTLPGVHIDSEDVVVTDENFGAANPDMEATRVSAIRTLYPELERNHIPVLGGFIGRSHGGATTTLGRGGSDYSAAIIGAAIDASEIQIWTDVDGMMTCDPRVIPAAKIIERISYVEAAELAYFGAKVLHPKTIAPAVEKQIPIRVLNTHNVKSGGTLITEQGDPSKTGARAIALKKGITVIHVTASQMLGAHGFLARIFEVFARHRVSVDLVTTSEISVSVTVDNDGPVAAMRPELEKIGTVRVERQQSIVAMVGRGLINHAASGTAAFQVMSGIPISMISFGSSGLNLSFVVSEEHADTAVARLHRALFEERAVEVA